MSVDIVICGLLIIATSCIFIEGYRIKRLSNRLRELIKDPEVLYIVDKLIHEEPSVRGSETVAKTRARLKYSLLHLKLQRLVPDDELRRKIYAIVCVYKAKKGKR